MPAPLLAMPLAAVVAAVDLPPAAIEAPVDGVTTPVQAAIGPVAPPPEPIRQAVPACRVGTARPLIEFAVDAVAAAVQAILYAVAAPIETILDTVTGIRKHRGTAKQQSGDNNYMRPDVHGPLPGLVKKLRLSGPTTRHRAAR